MPSALSVLRQAGAAVLLLAAVAVTALALYVFWPVGVALGVALGAGAVLAVGARMQAADRMQSTDADLAETLGIIAQAPAPAHAEVRPVALPAAVAPAPLEPVLHAQPDVIYFTSDEDPDVAEPREVVSETVRGDLDRLKAELGDDYRDFARAARLVVSTQYASAARLQRDLDLPYSRARRLLSDLEARHFVGPATGSLPRQVLYPKERLPEVEQLLAEV